MGVWELLGLAFLGGLVLNISPCILPVLSIKILSFLRMGAGNKVKALVHGLLYGAGIVISFLILAGITIVIQLAGGIAIFGILMLGSSTFNWAVGFFLAFLGLHTLGFNRKVLALTKKLLKGLKKAPDGSK